MYSKESQLGSKPLKKEKKPMRKVSTAQASFIAKAKAFQLEVWNSRPHICEECSAPLGDELNGRFISHIIGGDLSRKLYLDPRNVNILCLKCHDEWEYGDRKKMRIHAGNVKLMQELIR